MRRNLYRPFYLLFLIGIVATVLFAKISAVQAADLGYDKGFYLLSDDEKFRFKFNIQIQTLHEFIYKETETDQNTFKFARLRTYFSGHSFSPKFKYNLTVDYSSGGAALKDAHVDLDLVDYFKIRAGQFYLPLNREDLYSGIGLQLVDASIVSTHFGIGRDRGVMFQGKIVKPLTYQFFVVNGDSRAPADSKVKNESNVNKNKKFLIGTGFIYTALGKLGGFQGDPDYSESPNLGFATSVLYDFGNASETQDFETFTQQGILPHENKLTRGDLDGTFTWMGFSILGQWQFVYNNEFRALDTGYLVQSGYYIIPKKVEVAGRYAAVIPDFPNPALSRTGLTAAAGGNGVPVYEWGGGLNYYIQGHPMKIQTDYDLIMNDKGFRNKNNHIVRTQLTLVF